MPGQQGITKRTFAHLELKDDRGRFVVTRPEVVDAAWTIFEMYGQRTGKRATKQNIAYFYKAAEKAMELKESPEQYATTQLNGMLKFSLLYPQAMVSDVVREAGKEVSTSLDAVQHYKAMLESYKELSKIYGSRILHDQSAGFTPLFRYCLLVSLNKTEEAGQYLAAAKMELAANPAVKDIFGKYIS